jgi:GNAT superfamily N-acetyltransferase
VQGFLWGHDGEEGGDYGEAAASLYGCFLTTKAVKSASTDCEPDLHMLHTDPEYQGRGAGSALMDWGKQKADELRLPIYLESSRKGHLFYQKHGFKDIEVLDIDLSKFGGPVHKQPLMIWEPSKSQ